MGKNNYFNRQIALPQDHGSCFFLLSPLFIGIFAGGAFTHGTITLILATLAVFLLRQPTAVIVKAYAGRRPRSDLPVARLWFGVYGVIVLWEWLHYSNWIRARLPFLPYQGFPYLPAIYGWSVSVLSVGKPGLK